MLLLTSLALAAPNVAVPLEGNGDSLVLDELAVDRVHSVAWIPAAGSGTVQALDLATRTLKTSDGFGTDTVARNGLYRKIGPSTITVGDGTVYVGDRADNTVCAVDVRTYIRGACLRLDAAPGSLAWVASTHELWVTQPKANTVLVLDVTGTPKQVAKIELAGSPEGIAVNESTGMVYVNLGDTDQTSALDLKKRSVTTTWAAKCGEDGPRGILAPADKPFLLVACTDHLQSVDPAKKGKVLATLDTGVGLDRLDYLPKQKWIYAAAGRAKKLTIAMTDAKGAFTVVTVIPTVEGAKNAAAADDGSSVVTYGSLGAVLYVPAPDLTVLRPSGE